MTDSWLHNPRNAAPCTIIAEVGQAHDGSLGMAHAFIDSAAGAGADAIKFQTHIAAAESTLAEPWRKRFSLQDETRLDYWRRMEFSAEQWVGLQRHSEERGLLFLSSPFSMEALELLERIGVAGWKIPSGEINNPQLLEGMGRSGRPVMISTGMSPWPEIDAAVARVRAFKVPLAVLQCTSMYPCPPEQVGLNVIGEFRARYQCAVGLSDHSASIYAGLAAASQGIEVLEVHITPSRELFGPDIPASVTTAELRQLVAGIRAIETMRANPVDKSAPPDAVTPLRDIFMKSVVASSDIPAGTLLRAEHLTTKKPGSGIPAERMESLLGLRTRRAVSRDSLISMDDLEAGS
ncbi:MAG: N-acetylneuraminate synthase family protein [Gammaproteobacteria bacterium]